MKNLLKDLRREKLVLQKVQKNLQRRIERAFVRTVELLNEIAARREGSVQKGDTDQPLRDSGQHYYMCADNEVEEAIGRLGEAISFVEEAEKQPKKFLISNKKKEVGRNNNEQK